MSDCSICCEKFNLQNHKKVICSFCNFETCRSCIQTYLLNTSNDPHCMNCKHAWNREFVDMSCTKVFRNKQLKEHRENVLFEREKSYLPESQEAAKREKQKRSIIKHMADVREEINKQRQLLYDLERNLAIVARGQTLEEGGETKKQFVRKCPVENCKGFLSSQWKCDMCENKICSKCNEIKQNDHECDPKNVETVNLLKKDTKPCPKCGTLIFKSSGCSQMWCTSCHTPFNWNTGKIESGIIHNPHFYEFQRNTGRSGANRNLGDIPCGGLPEILDLNQFFGKRPQHNNRRGYYHWDNTPKIEDLDEYERMVYGVHRLIVHFENVEFRYNLREEHMVINNEDLRVRYLLNEVAEDYFKRVIQQREKKVEKQRELLQILRMFTITGSDMLRQMVLRDISVSDFCKNIINLRDYTNNQLEIISKRYTSKTYHITKGWEYI